MRAIHSALAFATLGYHHSEGLFGSFCKIIPELIKEGNQQHIINVCYAFAISDLTGKYEKEFRQLWAVVVGFDSKMVTAEGSRQLFQVYAFSQAGGMGFSKPPISCFEAGRIFFGDINNQVSKSQKESLQFFTSSNLIMMRKRRHGMTANFVWLLQACSQLI
jgi:hypothetical protein